MIDDFHGRTAVITGAGSGFGLEAARIGAARGMNLVLVDVQADALDAARAELEATGVAVMAHRVDVADAAQMEALAHFETTVTFCFTPAHLGLAPHHTSPAVDAQGFADFCAWMIDRYAPAAIAETPGIALGS